MIGLATDIKSGRARRRLGAVLIGVATVAATLAAGGVAGGATGDLTYDGCITGETDSGPTGSDACKAIGSAAAGGGNSGLDLPEAAALSPDGSSLYVISASDDAVARFARDTASGKLAYKGCITGETASGPAGSGACAAIGSAATGGANSGLDSPSSLVVSPDGSSVYVTSSFDDAVARFARDTASGKLTYKGCISGETESGPTGSGACAAIGSAAAGGANSGLDGPRTVALSADGASLYVTSGSDDAISRFTRDATSGKLKYNDCITAEAESAFSAACDAILEIVALGGTNTGLDDPQAMALSSDGGSLYVESRSDDAVARFDRKASTGKLSFNGCISGEAASSSECATVASVATDGVDSGLDFPASLAMSADGTSLYMTSTTDDAVARFARKTSGGLTYKGCITGESASGPAGSGACDAIAAAGAGDSGLDGPVSVALSPDGASLYVAARSDSAVGRFKRDTASGKLTYKGCISGETESGPTGSGACDQIASAAAGGEDSGLGLLSNVALSADGASIYAVCRAR